MKGEDETAMMSPCCYPSASEPGDPLAAKLSDASRSNRFFDRQEVVMNLADYVSVLSEVRK
jgi:hypothetical protein